MKAIFFRISGTLKELTRFCDGWLKPQQPKWLPEYGKFKTWHYIDIPINQPHLDMTRDCPKGDCVIAKIEDFQKVLADPAAKPEQRKEALMFLVHFIGDMHQPLHCSDNKDRGGNEVRVDFFGRNMNLHSVWDGGLLGRIDGGAEDAVFAELSKNLSDGRAKKWGKGTVRDWAEQSHKAAVKIVYGKLPEHLLSTDAQPPPPALQRPAEGLNLAVRAQEEREETASADGGGDPLADGSATE